MQITILFCFLIFSWSMHIWEKMKDVIYILQQKTRNLFVIIYIRYSTPNRPGWKPNYSYFSSNYVIDGYKNITHTNFQIFLKISLAVIDNQNNTKILLLLLKEVLGHVNNFFNKISSFKHEPLIKIFTFAMLFQRYGDEPLSFIAAFLDR